MSYENNVRFPEVHLEYPGWVRRKVDWLRPRFGDRDRMRVALDVARENAMQTGGAPFGAAVFDDTSGMLISIGMNCVASCGTSVMHAEIVAIMMAQKKLGMAALPDSPPCSIDSSCEPCPMCLGAVLWSGARRLVWGALRDDALRAGFDPGPALQPLFERLGNDDIALVSGALRDEAREILEVNRPRRA
jgi:tRNA(Arg) A34 adenosine deaminase TadA